MCGSRGEDMRETYYFITGLISAAVAYVSGKMGILMPLIGLLTLMMIVDYITGMGAAKKEAVEHPEDPSYGWSSKKGFNGIIKKVAIFAVITVSISLDSPEKITAP
jgi:phage-related holin